MKIMLMVHAIYGVKSLTEVEVITSSRKYELKIFDFAGHTQGLVVVDREGQFRFDPVFTVIYHCSGDICVLG